MSHLRGRRSPLGETSATTRTSRPTALQRSALRRLAAVALPVAVLWTVVAFALDRFA